MFSVAQAQSKLTLEKAISLALKNHPSIKAQKDVLTASRFAKDATKANRWFKANLIVQAERHNDPVTITSIKGPGQFPPFSRDIYFWQVEATFPLYEGGRVAQEVKIKDLEINIRQSLLRQSTEDLIANVKQLFFQVLYLKSLVKAQRELYHLLKEQYHDASLKYQVGRIARLDLLYFKRALEEEKALLLASESNLHLAKKLLALVIGLEDNSFEVSGHLEPLKNVNIKSFSAEKFLEERPDVKAARLKVKQAEAAISRAKREYLPTISAFSSYGRRAGAGLNNDEEVWVAGVRLNWSIFDSGVKRNLLKEKQALWLAAKEELQNLRLSASQEIISAVSQINLAKSQVNRLKAAEEFAREAYKREALRYQAGAGSINDLLQAQEAWLRTKSNLLKAYYDLNTAVVSFELATGQIAKEFSNE
ncbi:TolC family protein [Thermodesulfatator autotrophicus]|nr:TolC family protein [Thermodesulfatator autotrophicus]